MGTALLIGLTGALGCLALGLGVFVLGQPPAHLVERKSHGSTRGGAEGAQRRERGCVVSADLGRARTISENTAAYIP
jgi:hypothetical protein